MKALTLLLCLAALPAVATEPPDWLAYIPAEQRAALLATRHASPPSALIGSVPPQGYRGPESAAYAAPQPPAQFDASALVGPRRYDLDYHIGRRHGSARCCESTGRPAMGWQLAGASASIAARTYAGQPVAGGDRMSNGHCAPLCRE